MGVFKKIDKDGQIVYGIDYYAYGRRYRQLVGPRKGLADAALAKAKVEIAEDKFLDKKKVVKIKFEDFIDIYIENHCRLNHSNVKKGAETQAKWLRNFFKGKYLHEIDTMAVEQFKRKRLSTIRPVKGKRVKEARAIKPGTVNRGLAILKNIFNKAIAWEKFHGKNPVVGVKMLNEGSGRLRYLEKEEVVNLLANCEGFLKPAVIIALNTGMRFSEQFNLKWNQIDFHRNIIHLYQTTNKTKREVFMNDQVKNALVSIKKHPKSSYVFVYKNGERIRDIRKHWFKALEKANIQDFRWHDLRHTFASHLVMSGVDLMTVKELLGHKSLNMTLRYSHLSQSHKQRAVDALSRCLDVKQSLYNKNEVESDNQVIESLSKQMV